jgi:Periplasmic copper-binding protein (NosD)
MRVWAIILAMAMGGPALAEAFPLVKAEEILLGLPKTDDAVAMATAARAAGGEIGRIAGIAPVRAREMPDIGQAPAGAKGAIARDAVQLAMTQLAIDAGTNDMLGVMRAQQDGQAIYVTAGSVTLADIAAADDGLKAMNGVYHLTQPLIIWSDAALVIAPGEALVMDRAAGAFVLSFGGVTVTEANIRGEGAAPAGSPDFAPFVLVAGRGWIEAVKSEFANLGIAETTLFSGFAVVTRGLLRPDRATQVSQNSFADVRLVLLQGSEGAQVHGNLVTGDLSGGITLSGGTGGVIADNDLLAKGARAGIRVTDEAVGAVISGNLVLGAPVNGIVLDVAANEAQVSGNVVMFSGGAGLVLRRTSCVQVSGNILARNGATGLRMQSAGRMDITGNAVLLNGGVGVEVLAQPAASATVIADNIIAGNREGLHGAGLGTLTLSSNQLSAQLPRLFGGEFAQYQPAFLTATEQQDLTDFGIGVQQGARIPCGEE